MIQEYIERGAVIQEDLSNAQVVIGVKQVPIDLLMPDKTFCFFSHTIKAQKDNMPLLDAILEKVLYTIIFIYNNYVVWLVSCTINLEVF